jgi:hypothetical protein
VKDEDSIHGQLGYFFVCAPVSVCEDFGSSILLKLDTMSCRVDTLFMGYMYAQKSRDLFIAKDYYISDHALYLPSYHLLIN